MSIIDFKDIKTQIDVNETSVVVTGNKESKNIIAMLMLVLCTNNSDFGIGTHWDIKLIKKGNELIAKFGEFKKDNNNKIIKPSDKKNILTNLYIYDRKIAYNKILTNEYFELGTLLTIMTDYGLKENGDMQIAIKNKGFIYEAKIGLDKNQTQLKEAIINCGLELKDDDRVNIFNISDNIKNNSNNILINLREINIKPIPIVKEIVSQNGSIKQAFMITILVTEMILLIVGSFFIFR